MPTHPVVEQLAQQHAAHLAWLRARLHGRLAPDEVEDVLQGAYARALSALSAPAAERPLFAGPGQSTAWLRTIALNQACDLLRARHGRARDGQVPRRADTSLDAAVSARLVADVDVEDEVLGAVERESYRPLVLEAIARLDSRHRQILQLRYGRDLTPAAVMVLAGIDRRQWDGRHTRALKAFGRALSRLPVGRDCRQLRRLLKTSPVDLLASGGGAAADHVASCVACAAFTSASRFAVVALPLPLPIESWRLDAVEALTPPPAAPAPAALEPTSGVCAAAASSAGGAGPLAGFAATAVAVVTAAALMGPGGGERPGVAGDAHRTAAAAQSGSTRLAGHLTPRERLERGARELARRRAAAGKRRSAAGPATRRRVSHDSRTADAGTATHERATSTQGESGDGGAGTASSGRTVAERTAGGRAAAASGVPGRAVSSGRAP